MKTDFSFSSAENVLSREEMRHVFGGNWDGRCGFHVGNGVWVCNTTITYEQASEEYSSGGTDGYCCASCGSYNCYESLDAT